MKATKKYSAVQTRRCERGHGRTPSQPRRAAWKAGNFVNRGSDILSLYTVNPLDTNRGRRSNRKYDYGIMTMLILEECCENHAGRVFQNPLPFRDG
jgi:hypothetical protein